MSTEIPTLTLDDDSIDALYNAFDSIKCSSLEPDFDSFEELPIPPGVASIADTDEVSFVITDVCLDTDADGVRGIWATMRPYMWSEGMRKEGALNGSLNATPKFRLAVIEGNVNQSVLFARKKLLETLEDTILTWDCDLGDEE